MQPSGVKQQTTEEPHQQGHVHHVPELNVKNRNREDGSRPGKVWRVLFSVSASGGGNQKAASFLAITGVCQIAVKLKSKGWLLNCILETWGVLVLHVNMKHRRGMLLNKMKRKEKLLECLWLGSGWRLDLTILEAAWDLIRLWLWSKQPGGDY